MASQKEKAQWKSVLPAAGLVSLVLLILLVTAVVRTGREPELMQRSAGAGEPSGAPAAEPESIPRPQPDKESATEAAPPPSRRTNSVRDRADGDYLRLAGKEAMFTSHLMLSCDQENTRRHMDGAGWHDDLYLLPAEYHGQDCFRLCWNVYPTREAAEAEGAILPYLAREFPDRTPKALAEIRP